MTDKVKTIGVIGLGSIGLRHKTNLWKHLGQTEVLSYDPDPEKRQGTGWVVGNAEKLIEICNVLIICSPTFTHASYAVNCVQEKKSCFVEKPIGGSEVPFELFPHEILKKVTMVGYNLRFHPCVIKAKEWLDAGDIGEPIWANFVLGQFNSRPAYLRDGVILNWSHEIDLCLYLLGPGRLAHSSTRFNDGRDDLTDILYTHDNGCHSTIHLDYVTEPEVRQSIIVGTEATVIIDFTNHQGWLRDKDGQILEVVKAEGGWDQTYIDEMQAFLDRIDGKATLGATGEEGLEVLKICLEIRKQAGL